MARRKQPPRDLTGIRQRGGRYQVQIFGSHGPGTGKQVIHTGSVGAEDVAVELQDEFPRQVKGTTAAQTNATLEYLLDEWLSGHRVEETTRDSYVLLLERFIKPALDLTPLTKLCQLGAEAVSSNSTPNSAPAGSGAWGGLSWSTGQRGRMSATSAATRTCAPLAVPSVQQCHAVLSAALNAAMRWGEPP